ncbi:MAG: hypothetical protein ACRBCI_12295 [Cellvibrionaceae bacterium]
MTDKHSINESSANTPPDVIVEQTMTSFAFDSQHFTQEIEELAIDPKQAEALLENLWHIMAGFVDLGWGADSVQLLLPDLFEPIAEDSVKLVKSGVEDETNAKQG